MRKGGSIKTKVSHSTYISTRELSRKGGSMAPLDPPLDPPLNISDNTSACQFTYFAIVYTPYRRNWLSTVKTLVKKRNVDVNSVDSDGASALHKACR